MVTFVPVANLHRASEALHRVAKRYGVSYRGMFATRFLKRFRTAW